jgi:hypothetical protein
MKIFYKKYIFSAILIGGKSPNEGNVFARNTKTNYFGPVCDDHFGIPDVGFHSL